MEHTPFTLEDAHEISEDFEDLVDTEFKIGASPMLMALYVGISPFDDANKKIFLERYQHSPDAASALAFYKGDDYDVILITCADDETAYSFVDIRTFAELKGISYSFPA